MTMNLNSAGTERQGVNNREISPRIENEVNGRLLDLERQVARLSAQLAALDSENQMNRARVMQVRTSLSWRITRPLRRARRLIMRRSGGNL